MASSRAKELRANIVIGGRVDAAQFRAITEHIQQLGEQMGRLAVPIVNFGKEAVRTYADYEDAMLDAKAALSTQYYSTTALEQAYDQLNKKAEEWAASSRFSTKDVAEGIANAAHAGWDLQKIMKIMPSAMSAAQAGGMDLSEALSYIIDIANAAGLSFDQLADFTDIWAFAGNKASTTIPEMGQAMQRMGASLGLFKGDIAMAATMLGILANNGTKGSDAGTMLRNVMLRLAAPTKTAAAALKDLNAEDQEYLDSLADADWDELGDAMGTLKDIGVSVYDEDGNLRSMLSIFKDLNEAMTALDWSEAEINGLLGTLFGQRAFQGGRAFLNEIADGGWEELYMTLLTGSQGYAAKAGEIMEGGVGGALRHLESLYNTVLTKTGKSLGEDVSGWAGALSGLLQGIVDMDDATFTGLVSGLETIAGLGTTMGVAAAAIGGITNFILTTGPTGAAVLAGVGLVAVANGISAYVEAARQAEFDNSFGTMVVDMQEIGNSVDSMLKPFDDARRGLETYDTIMAEAMQKYEEAASTLSVSLATKAISGAELTSDDMEKLFNLGKTMATEAERGITAQYSEAMVGFEAATGKTREWLEKDQGVYGSIFRLMNAGYQASIKEVQGLSQELRDAMTSAFDDKEVTPEEAAKITELTNALTGEMLKSRAIMNAVTAREIELKAQRLDYRNIGEIAGIVNERRNAALKGIDDDYLGWYQAAASGWMAEHGSMEGFDASEEAIALRTQRDTLANEVNAMVNTYMLNAFEEVARGNGMGDLWDAISGIAQLYLDRGGREGAGLSDDEWQAYAELAKGPLGGIFKTMLEEFAGLFDESVLENSPDLALLRTILGINSFGAGNALRGTSAGVLSETEIDPNELALSNYQTAVKALVEAYNRYWGEKPKNYKESGELDRDREGLYGHYTTYDYDKQFLNGPLTDAVVAAENELKQLGLDVPLLPDTVKIYEAIEEDFPITLDAPQENLSKVAGKIQTFLDTHPFVIPISDVQITGGSDPNGNQEYRTFAYGGRSNEAAIFGEAGPEWAIPEQHSVRTARLLDAARAAAGFSYGELMSLSGGGKSNGGNTLVYSPTIYANDASGVAGVLRNDKEKLEEYLNKRQMRDSLEVYA